MLTASDLPYVLGGPLRHSEAHALGLADGLRAVTADHSFRCGCCFGLTSGVRVWVPAVVRRGDPRTAVTEACRTSHRNEGWCVDCAKTFT